MSLITRHAGVNLSRQTPDRTSYSQAWWTRCRSCAGGAVTCLIWRARRDIRGVSPQDSLTSVAVRELLLRLYLFGCQFATSHQRAPITFLPSHHGEQKGDLTCRSPGSVLSGRQHHSSAALRRSSCCSLCSLVAVGLGFLLNGMFTRLSGDTNHFLADASLT